MGFQEERLRRLWIGFHIAIVNQVFEAPMTEPVENRMQRSHQTRLRFDSVRSNAPVMGCPKQPHVVCVAAWWGFVVSGPVGPIGYVETGNPIMAAAIEST